MRSIENEKKFGGGMRLGDSKRKYGEWECRRILE